MRPEYAELLRSRLAIPPTEGPDKTATLEDAVRRLVEPGQTLWVGAAHGRPAALVRELVRQWWGRRPDWTLALTGFGSPMTALVLGGLVRRLVTTFVGEGYPFPVPQALVGPAILSGAVSVQNWSMLTMPLRALARTSGLSNTSRSITHTSL